MCGDAHRAIRILRDCLGSPNLRDTYDLEMTSEWIPSIATARWILPKIFLFSYSPSHLCRHLYLITTTCIHFWTSFLAWISCCSQIMYLSNYYCYSSTSISTLLNATIVGVPSLIRHFPCPHLDLLPLVGESAKSSFLNAWIVHFLLSYN